MTPAEPFVIYTHRDDLSAAACERIRAAVGRLVEFRPLPVAAPVLPGLERLRKCIARLSAAHVEYGRVCEASADTDAWRVARGAAADAVDTARGALGYCALISLPAILDAVDAGPTFLEAHAAPMAAQAARSDAEREAREELDAARKIAGDVIDSGMLDPSPLSRKHEKILKSLFALAERE